MKTSYKKIAIFPGTFDPFTLGHLSIIERGLEIFDHIVIGIGINEQKRTLFTVDQRVEMLTELFATEPRVNVVAYNGVTIDFATSQNAHYILRGMRTVSDFEYEKTIADLNRALSGVETCLLFSLPQHAHISSTAVRELLHFGKRSALDFVPSALQLKKYL